MGQQEVCSDSENGISLLLNCFFKAVINIVDDFKEFLDALNTGSKFCLIVSPSIITSFPGLDKKLVRWLKESWVFVPDPDIAFHRLSEQESFDPDMTPNGSIVCCEIMSNDSRSMNILSDEELISAAQKGLADMGYRNFNVLGKRVIRLPKSYPVFRPGFEEGLSEIITAFDGFENFKSLGRQGAFNYIGTLDAMDIGYGFVRWYLQRDATLWSKERERTNHYPVLD